MKKPMTPKQKAKQLSNKYLKTGMMIRQAKECALICVDEMLNTAIGDFLPFLAEVKKEIEKL